MLGLPRGEQQTSDIDVVRAPGVDRGSCKSTAQGLLKQPCPLQAASNTHPASHSLEGSFLNTAGTNKQPHEV